MERSASRRKSPARRAAKPTPAELDRLYAELEQAVQAADAARTAELTQQLWKARDQVGAVLAQRVRAGRAALPGLALDLLAASVASAPLDALVQSRFLRTLVERSVAQALTVGLLGRALESFGRPQ